MPLNVLRMALDLKIKKAIIQPTKTFAVFCVETDGIHSDHIGFDCLFVVLSCVPSHSLTTGKYLKLIKLG